MADKLIERIDLYREETYRSSPDKRLQTKEEAVDFINQRGAILFHPAKDIEFPSLWVAKAGNRPVPNEHDDPGHITWSWKDELLGQRKCYYGRLLGQKMSFLSIQMLPSYFRLSRNIEYENDYLRLYQMGEMSYETKRIFECLLAEGPLDTLLLRRKAGLWGKENQYRYSKALNWLQTEMMVMPIGIAEVGRWNYGFILDIVPRFFHDLSDQSLTMTRNDAKDKVLENIVTSLGATSEINIRRILRWSPVEITRTINHLEEKGIMTSQVKVEGKQRMQLVLNELLI
jgi:hypothetical protein